jgi:hypothetical protein
MKWREICLVPNEYPGWKAKEQKKQQPEKKIPTGLRFVKSTLEG